jgi:hypothetical protein
MASLYSSWDEQGAAPDHGIAAGTRHIDLLGNAPGIAFGFLSADLLGHFMIGPVDLDQFLEQLEFHESTIFRIYLCKP